LNLLENEDEGKSDSIAMRIERNWKIKDFENAKYE
jgi:hypothetical protein